MFDTSLLKNPYYAHKITRSEYNTDFFIEVNEIVFILIS